MDSEGSWLILKNHENNVKFVFHIKSQDLKILEQIKDKLILLEFSVGLYPENKRGEISGFGIYVVLVFIIRTCMDCMSKENPTY